MSIQAVAWALEQTIPDQGAKLVLISLANAYNGKSGRCFPSLEQIMFEASCSRATVKRKLAWLIEHGWIEAKSRFDGTGRQRSNTYTFNFDPKHEGGAQIEPGEGPNLSLSGFIGEPGEGLICEPPLKEPEELPEKDDLSETSSDVPSRTKGKPAYPEDFEKFWQAYPRSPNMSKAKTYQAWRRLSDDDKGASRRAIELYLAFLKARPDHPTMHATTFINERRFDGFLEQAPASRTVTDDDWQKRLAFARTNRQWHIEAWGPFPGADCCRVPTHLLRPQDGRGWAEWDG